ncbi:MAG: DUF4358 domain-containing protein [Oscillospiraceae bacterium]|jgi:hypothetical protein|nr:DUF4358 domain-containing protein [Oscillospiraceae bacterium]
MKKISLPALALTGAMVLTLAACGSKEPEATPTPEVTNTPEVVESVMPSETPEVSPEVSESPEVSAPEESGEAQDKPVETQKPSQEPAPSEAPAEESKVQAAWTAISDRELPFFQDLDDSLLSDFYGVDPADLVEYICKIPFMNTQATEFFIAQVQPGKMDTVKAALEARQADLLEQWSQYLPDQLELVKNYKLVTNGDYVMFAIADCAEEAVTAFNDCTK